MTFSSFLSSTLRVFTFAQVGTQELALHSEQWPQAQSAWQRWLGPGTQKSSHLQPYVTLVVSFISQTSRQTFCGLHSHLQR